MKTIVKQMLTTVCTISPAWAAVGAEPEGNGLMVILFLGFGALIIVFQLVPALTLFVSMVKGLFRKPKKAAALAEGEAAETE